MKKRIISMILILVQILSLTSVLAPSIVQAATSSTLITVNGKTVTTDDTIQTINQKFGEPKLVTPSAFGGHSYTYYGQNYADYLYIETNVDEKIVSYGSIDEKFTTSDYSYGDAKSYPITYSTLTGYILGTSTVKGVILYRPSPIGSSYKAVSTFENNYESDPVKYLKSISQQTFEMYKALCYKKGKTTNVEWDEDIFYMNEQLKELGTDMRKTIEALDKDAYCDSVYSMAKYDLNRYGALLNPMSFLESTANGGAVDIEGAKMIFDYNLETSSLSVYGIDTDVFEETNLVEMTQEEQTKLENARAEYQKAQNYFSQATNFYTVEPQYNTTDLVAGEVNPNILNGLLAYINSIRLAAGSPRIALDSSLTNKAQHKSTLLNYRWRVLGLDIDHFFDKPDGISQEFYDIAQDFSEEIVARSGNYAVSSELAKGFIEQFIADDGVPSLGHRRSVLDPAQGNMGIGITESICAGQFSGSQATNQTLLAWPTSGITPLEAIDDPNRLFEWSAEFSGDYKINQDTTVTVKCLNTDDTWNFSTANGSNISTGKTCVVEGLYNMIRFYDKTMYVIPNYTYEITLNNIQNKSTGQSTSYTYRTVFAYLDESNSEYITDFTIDKTSLTMVVGNTDKISITSTTPENGIDKFTNWSTSNKDIVTVTQNGTVTALAEGTATISVEMAGITKKCEVTVTNLMKGDVNKDKKVNLYDALQILKKAIIEGDLTEEERYIMDYNDDGNVNLYDALQFLKQAIIS